MINNYYNKYIKYKIKYLNLGGMDNDNDDIFTINLTSGKILTLNPSILNIYIMDDLIQQVAKHLDVYPLQISLVQDDEIISDNPLMSIGEIKRDLTCIIKPGILYVYYKFISTGCYGGCGIGRLYVSLDKPVDKYDYCEILKPNMCLYYKIIKNSEFNIRCCAGGFIRYTSFHVGLITDSNFEFIDDIEENDYVDIYSYILSYDDAMKVLDYPNEEVDETLLDNQLDFI